MPAERTAVRLERILVLVPWVMAAGTPAVEEVCRRFGMTREELAADLDTLFVCGLPPFGPGDLIEAAIDGDRVVIRMADYLSKPPRLTRMEAVAMLVMGRALASLPGLEEAHSLRRALSKLADAVSPEEARHAEETAARVAVELDAAGADLLGAVRRAADERARLRIAYYSHGRAEMSEREVDPLTVFGAMGNWYLVAFDHASGEERVFRVDRIKEAMPTGERFDPPAGFDPARYEDAPLFTPSTRDIEVVLDLAPAAAWMKETIPFERETPLADGWTRIELRTPNLAWLVGLLLSAGEHARAAAPLELDAAVREAARRALARYDSSAG